MKVRTFAESRSLPFMTLPVTRSSRRGFASVAIAAAVAMAAIVAGCGDSAKKPANPGDAKAPVEVRSITVDHEACAEGGNRVEAYDADGDGKPDVRKVFSANGRELCRTTDLNHNGQPELYEYYGPSGDTRRREASYVESGEVTSIEYFEGGKRVRRELDTTGQHRIDTWDYFDPASGKRTKRERDINGDGRIDQWWQWDGDKLTIAIDKTGDGRPDPEATIVQGGSGTMGPPPAATTATPTPTTSAAPTTPATPVALTEATPATTGESDAGAGDGGTKKPKAKGK